MPDDWEEQKRRAQSPFNNEPALSDAIRQAAQKAREDVEKLTKRFSLQIQDELKLRGEEREDIINLTVGRSVGEMRHFSRVLNYSDSLENVFQIFEEEKD